VKMRTSLALALLLVALAACSSSLTLPGTPVSLRTAPAKAEACDAALLAGELVASAQSGLAIRSADDVTEVIWPYGYSASRQSSGLVLHDETGRVVGHEGQRMEVGGSGANGVWFAYGSVREVSNVGG